MKSRVLAVLTTCVLAVGVVAGSASAQNQNQNGLVNVAVGDVLVQLPIAVAANVCDVNVAVLAQVTDTGDGVCTADAQAVADAITPPGGGGPNQNQQGLVNIAIGDVTVQVPVGIAANVCDVNVAVLAAIADAGDTLTCDASADSSAG
jgi:hypothetical protein